MYIVGKGMMSHGVINFSVLGGRIIIFPLRFCGLKTDEHGLINENRCTVEKKVSSEENNQRVDGKKIKMIGTLIEPKTLPSDQGLCPD